MSEVLGVNLWDFNFKEYRPHVTKVEGAPEITKEQSFCVRGILTNDNVLVALFD
jgi:hypothetical protein